MSAKKRFKTRYPGVYYIEGKTIGAVKKELIYYIVYRKDGRQIEKKSAAGFKTVCSLQRPGKFALTVLKAKVAAKECPKAKET